MLNIWGVMLFIRLSWIVGEAGIGKRFFLSYIIFNVNYKLNKQFVFIINAECEMKVTEIICTWAVSLCLLDSVCQKGKVKR